MKKRIYDLFEENDNFLLRKVYYDFNRTFNKENVCLRKQLKYDNDFLKLIDYMLDDNKFRDNADLYSLKKLRYLLAFMSDNVEIIKYKYNNLLEYIKLKSLHKIEVEEIEKIKKEFELDYCYTILEKTQQLIEEKENNYDNYSITTPNSSRFKLLLTDKKEKK